jgi:WD40 repeat protein
MAPVCSVCWNEDAGRIVSGSSDGKARVWDMESGKTVLKIKTEFSGAWTGVATYSPDMTMIATGGKKQMIKFGMRKQADSSGISKDT